MIRVFSMGNSPNPKVVPLFCKLVVDRPIAVFLLHIPAQELRYMQGRVRLHGQRGGPKCFMKKHIIS